MRTTRRQVSGKRRKASPRRLWLPMALCISCAVPTWAGDQAATKAVWFPDAGNIKRFSWNDDQCPDCEQLATRPEWARMAQLAGVLLVDFRLTRATGNSPAWSYAPGTVVLTQEALNLPRCQLNFLIGHELAHIAQRHFDEDAQVASVLSGFAASWTSEGSQALSLLDGDFPLAMRMEAIWHHQEREADWVGALLTAQACGCTLEQGALAYLGKDSRSGGGVISAHDESAARVRHLHAFSESARRLATRAY